jgi:CDP-glucose 4,6-dehydratase
MVINADFWAGRRVLLTGHTGFKGSLLALWLTQLGAEVTGFALDPATTPALFDVLGLATKLRDLRGDVREAAQVANALQVARPAVVFHLAAQPLVRESYLTPVATLATNVMGTANVLEAVRGSPETKAVVVVTSDKCYANDGSGRRYRETDALGGFDPYSSSKACAELVTAAYRDSFLARAGVAVATVRAGNVIGGGDWAAERLLPDVVRAWTRHEPVLLRNPHATRPWQHALAPLAGCLTLAEKLTGGDPTFASAWNFGPADGSAHSVATVVANAAQAWGPGAGWEVARGEHPHEAPVLGLDSTRAVNELGFRSPWALERAVNESITWYRQHLDGADMRRFTLSQIESYTHDLSHDLH